MNSLDLSSIKRLLREAVTSGVCSGAQVAISGPEGQPTTVWDGHISSAEGAPRVTDETLFDLASLTKVFCATTIAARFAARKVIHLGDCFSKAFPDLPWNPQYREATVSDLLTHQAGFPDWVDFSKDFQDRKKNLPGSSRVRGELVRKIASIKPEAGCGEKSIYSDLGYIILGEYLARVGGGPLSKLFRDEVSTPLGLERMLPLPLEEGLAKEEIAATRDVPWRGGVLQGEVDDDNTYLLGGLAGQAGLFGTARSCARLAQAWLASFEGKGDFFPQELATSFFEPKTAKNGAPRALGWDLAASKGSAAGSLVTPQSPGHLGYTGTSVWIDLSRKTAVVLLTNRVHPSAENEKIKTFRPRLYDEAWRALDR